MNLLGHLREARAIQHLVTALAVLKQLHSAGQLTHSPPAYTRCCTVVFQGHIHGVRWHLPEPASPDEILIRLYT